MFLQSFCVCVRQLFHFFLIERVNAPDFIHFGNCTFISTTHNFRSHSHISIIAMPNRSSCCCCFFLYVVIRFVCLFDILSFACFRCMEFSLLLCHFLVKYIIINRNTHVIAWFGCCVYIHCVVFLSFSLVSIFFLVLFYCFGCHHRVFCLIVSRSICGSDAYRIHPVARALSSYRTLCRALCLIRLSLHCDRMKWS